MPEPRPIAKLLVANRGEIARRVFRTARAMGIATVAVCSDPDADAVFTHEADEVVRLGGASPAESYLRGDAIVAAALRTGADAVHPGYGFLSEDAAFARRCGEAGLTFVGPPVAAIEAMGSKLAAKALMEGAGVPVLGGADVTSLDADSAELAEIGVRIGWPVLVKAAFGGGGRGMRIVRRPEELGEAVTAARREAASAFGNDSVFLERYVEAPRHVEIQLFADTHGNVVHLFERECSIQRRHQKIVEEAPSPAVDEALRAEMGAAAVAAGKAIGYEGAGTVEFLLAPGGEFFFLEVNTRLQVEHPVTEAVTGLDLVRLQILVAEGHPLPDEVRSASIDGHAIEVRLYAEDPEHDYLPASGALHRFGLPEGPGLRVDSGVEDGSVVPSQYDPMLAKVIAHAPTRPEAARRLAGALSSMELHGVVTNRDLLVGVLRHPEFLAGAIDTHFLERHPPAELARSQSSAGADRLHAVVAAMAVQSGRRGAPGALATIPSGWRNNPSQRHLTTLEGRRGPVQVRYLLGHDGLAVEVDGEALGGAHLVSCRPGRVVLEAEGVRRTFATNMVDDRVFVDGPLGHSAWTLVDPLPLPDADSAPGSLLAPMPGTVVRVAVVAGDAVEAGALLVVMEAMKMEHRLTAPHAGTVAEIRVAVGAQVQSGDLLAVVELDDE